MLYEEDGEEYARALFRCFSADTVSVSAEQTRRRVIPKSGRNDRGRFMTTRGNWKIHRKRALSVGRTCLGGGVNITQVTQILRLAVRYTQRKERSS